MNRSSLSLPIAVGLGSILASCAPAFTPVPQRTHGSVGAEVFRVLCLNLAAQSFPNDLTGARFSASCDGKDTDDELDTTPEDAQGQRAYARYRALRARRDRVVDALDATFGADAYQPDELRAFLGNMVPLYDPPEQLPELTRSAATLLEQLIDPKDDQGAEALQALERMSTREGYRPAKFDLAITRALLRYPRLDELLRTTLAAIAPDGAAREPYQDLLRAGALDLATATPTIADPTTPGTLAVSMGLFLSEDDAFAGSSGPLFMTLRDESGVARPSTPADPGRSTPYSMFEQRQQVPRDTFGRALDVNGEPIYASANADRTLLAGLLREAGPLLASAPSGHAPLLDFTYGMNGLLGDYGLRSRTLGATQLSFLGPDTDQGPLFDFIHALSSVLPFEQTEALLDVFQRLLRDHERELAGLIEATLYIKERAEAYPDAKFDKPHDFWDGLIAWAISVSERPELLERMLRALGEDATAQAGPLMGNFMRFRDRVNYPLGSREELEALGIDPKQVMGKLTNQCTGPACGRACDLSQRCPEGLACVVSGVKSTSGVCGSIADAVAAHRVNVNYPCPNPPTALLGATDPAPGCVPHVDYPSAHHRGIRGCPSVKPLAGTSCSHAGGVGLCSWEQGSCTCDCEGGLCRHGAKPTWRCNETPTPGYADWVDRAQPDLREGSDGHSNQSLFQRTIALIHDLHVPAKWCNKSGAQLNIYDPAGSNSKALLNGVMGLLLGDLLGPYPECGLLNERSIVEFFGRTILGTAELKLQSETLQGTMSTLLPLMGMTQDQLMERQTFIRGLSVAPPKPEGIARMVFSPFVAYQNDLLDLTPSRDGKLIVDLHRDTISAWELNDPVSGASYYTALAPFLSAMDPTRGQGDSNLDLYGNIISLAHKHWSSRATDTTVRDCEEGSSPLACNENAALFSFQSNLVSYEELIAEALVDARLMSRLRDLSRALSAIHLPSGKDGITVLTETAFNLLQPRRSCLDYDCKANPLRARDGRTATTTNTGRPIDELSPLYLLLDALNAIDARLEGPMAERLRPWRDARSRIIDTFFDVERSAPEQWRFKSQRGRAILSESLAFLQTRLTQYRAEQDACTAGPCRQVHDWAFSLAPRLATALGQPVSAAALRLLESLRDLPSAPAAKLFDLAVYLTTEQAGDDTFQAMLLGTADLLQLLTDTENLSPVMAFGSRALAANASEVASGDKAELAIEAGTLEKALGLVRSLQDLAPESAGQKSTLAKLLARLASPYGKTSETPLDVIIETIAAVNRAAPAEQGSGPMSRADLRSVLDETSQFLQGKRHGLERLYDVIQSRVLH
ncbi:MAG TPA: hypothetical protein VI299_29630 [Polyangiales bacterium]